MTAFLLRWLVLASLCFAWVGSAHAEDRATKAAQKHFEKAAESLALLKLFSDIVDTMCLITHPDYLEIIENTAVPLVTKSPSCRSSTLVTIPSSGAAILV